MHAAVLLSLFAASFVEPLLPLRHVPALGECLPSVPATSIHTMTASAQTWPSYAVVDGGVRFVIGVDREERVRFVSTNDAAFVTPEGVRVGDPAAAAQTAAPGRAIGLEMGWGHYIELPSGWCAFIDSSWVDRAGHVQPNLNIGKLGPDARVSFFFMRN